MKRSGNWIFAAVPALIAFVFVLIVCVYVGIACIGVNLWNAAKDADFSEIARDAGELKRAFDEGAGFPPPPPPIQAEARDARHPEDET